MRLLKTIFVFLLLHVGINASAQDEILGSWKVAESGFEHAKANLIERLKKNYPPEALENLLKDPSTIDNMIRSTIIEYKANGVLVSTNAQGTTEGKWEIIKEGNARSIRRSFANGQIIIDSIISVSADKLVVATAPLKLAVVYERVDANTTPALSKQTLPLRKKQSEKQALANVTIVDVKTGRSQPGQTIIWENGLIKEIIDQRKAKIDPSVKVKDGTGMYVMPGLVDAHMHFFQSGGLYTRPDGIDLRKIKSYEDEMAWIRNNHPNQMRRYLAAGITSVVDLGGPFSNFTIRDSINARILAPRTIVTGPLISTYGPPNLDKTDPPIILAKTAEAAREQVRAQLPYKPSFIKIWFIALPGQTPHQFQEVVRAAIDESHSHKLKVAVHATEKATARLAVEWGADILVHSIDDEIIDEDLLKLMKKNRITYIPTLQVMQQSYKIFKQELDYTPYEIKNADPFQLNSSFDLRRLDKKLVGFDYQQVGKSLSVPSKQDSNMAINLKKVADYGITVVTGTDAGNPGVAHGASMIRELQMMKKAGLSNAQILTASTVNAATTFGVTQTSGTIEAGKNADFLVLTRNPLEDLSSLEQPGFICFDGVLYTTDELLPKNVEALAEREVAAYNAGNIEAFVACYAPDAEIYDFPLTGKPIAKGREEMKKIWGEMFRQFKNLNCEVTKRAVFGNRIVAYEQITGVPGAPLYAVGIYEFNLKTGLIDKVYFIQ